MVDVNLETRTPAEPKRRWPLHTKILVGLLIGATLGLVANQLVTIERAAEKASVHELIEKNKRAVGMASPPIGSDLLELLENIERVADEESLSTGADFRELIDRIKLAAEKGSLPTSSDLRKLVEETERAARPTAHFVKELANVAKLLGNIFLRLMFMVVVPLVFSALALAVVEIGDIRQLGRVGLRTLIFTLIFSFTAVVLGIVLVNLIGPGKVLSADDRQVLQEKYGHNAKLDENTAKIVTQAKSAKSIGQTLLDIIPENPLQEMVGAVDGSSKGNGMLAVMFFSLVFGATLTVSAEKTKVMIGWLEGLYVVAMTVIGWAMRLAPVGAGCLVFAITSELGFDILVTLFWFAATVLIGLVLQLVITYPIAIHFCSKMTPIAFFRGVRAAMLTAFGTSSSSATLPTALRVADQNLHLPQKISNFVLTVGATGNQNGTALYEGVVVLFLAQVFDVDLTVPQQIMVVLMSILAGVGTAGVPGGSLPLIVVVMQSVGVPAAGIGIILGVDRVLDMCRTVLNVTGDLAVATCVAGTDAESK